MEKAAPHAFNPEILREYDIRGKAGKTLFIEDAHAVGLAFGTCVRREGGRRVCLGYDGRETSPAFAEAAADGLMSTGIAVERLGLCSTPMLYFAVSDRRADGGLMITGSHNAREYNGFKLVMQDRPVFGEAVRILGEIAAGGDYETGEGSAADIDVAAAYLDRLLRGHGQSRPLNVAWDCGNGAAGPVVEALVKRLPGRHVVLHGKVDGRFPNHHPDPTVDSNLRDLIAAVRDNRMDLGVAFDGDADRIGVVDEAGRVIRCDTLLAVYARDVLARHPGAPVIGDVKCSEAMFREIRRLGGQPVMWKTGHSLIKSKMAALNAPLAGELSGHIFFRDGWYGFDDGVYCALRLIAEASRHDGPVSALTAGLGGFFNTPEIRFQIDEKDKFALPRRLCARLKAANDPEILDIDETDGVRVVTARGWWLLRASNTEDVLVARVEADSAEALDALKSSLAKAIQDTGHDIIFP